MDDKKISMYSISSPGTNEIEEGYQKVAAWFLGPKAENKDFYLELLRKSISEHMELRENYYPDEAPYIDQEVKESKAYIAMCELLEEKRAELSNKLRASVPFFSQRYQAHMNWDTLMAGSLGYMTAILYNQNNVATEASPVTSVLEKEVGIQLCGLLGYDTQKSWGHITADGTIANIESMWAARNLKAYPIAVKELLCGWPELASVKDKLLVDVYDEEKNTRVAVPLAKCSPWQLLNIEEDQALGLIGELQQLSHIPIDVLNEKLKPYLIATRGIAGYAGKYPELADMRIIVPATHHYSWPKAATLLGIGQDGVISIPVDEECKMDPQALDSALKECLSKHNPVLMVVAVVGSTAEGAVDNVVEIHAIKETYTGQGLSFHLHCDAAWGGYLRSMLIEPETDKRLLKAHFVPSLPLSNYAVKQFENICLADTITIDPHKAGYIPYAAGALCYRNSQLRHMITFNAAYIHSEEDTNMGIYGVEGSKPGAAAAAVWLAHQTVPLNKNGYGQILGECGYSSKLNYCYWITQGGPVDLSRKGFTDNYQYHVLPLIQVPSEISGPGSAEPFQSREEVMQYIQEHIVGKETDEIINDPRALMVLQNVGSDVLMNTFLVNFSINGKMNTDYSLMNQLNENIFSLFSITQEQACEDRPKFVLMMNTLSSSEYGRAFRHIVDEWGLQVDGQYNLNILVNTVLQPWPNSRSFVSDVMNIFAQGVAKALEQLLTKQKEAN